MKDTPAALLVVLSKRDTELLHRAFDRVGDNGRVLRTMFQMIRSGQFGRTSLSSSLQRAFQRWLNEALVGKLLSASIGNDPSLRDVLRMARPTPLVRAIGLGAFSVSATHAVSKDREQVANAVEMTALDFEQIVFDCAAGPAGGLELAK